MMLRALLSSAAALLLSACVVTAPAKTAAKAGGLAAKGTVAATTLTAETAWTAGELSVRVADGALDGTERALRLTILTADATGALARSTREVSATALEAELAALRRADAVVDVLVEPAR